MTPTYDEIQMAAVLTYCVRCLQWWWMTKPSPICCRCRQNDPRGSALAVVGRGQKTKEKDVLARSGELDVDRITATRIHGSERLEAGMNEDVRQSEAWVLRQAERLSALIRADARNVSMPPYATGVEALAVLLAGSLRLPCFRQLAERVQREHRSREHGGGRTDQCEACGWFDGAAYKATTGREFVEDFPELFQRGRASEVIR